jgi:hypothetical protein
MRPSKLLFVPFAFALALWQGPTLAQKNPHAGGGGGDGTNGLFKAPPDVEEEDDKLPRGTIAIEIRDAEDHPIPHAQITLGILHNTVAKGESREHKGAEANELGQARFDGLLAISGTAYRVTVPLDGATYGATPFQLPPAKGMHVVLHVYPVVHDIKDALVVTQGIVYVELKDDRIQVQQAFTIFNFGKVTWVPNDLVLPLGETFTALTSNQSMSDEGVDPVEKQGGRLHGTFGPGRHDVEFRWQLPYSGDPNVDFEIGMPPHMAAARVMVTASQQMKLGVEGFPEAQPNVDAQGNHILETQRELKREDGELKSVHISLRDIPVAGPARIIATCIAAFGVSLGLFYGASSGKRTGRSSASSKTERAQLLRELEDLEKGHAAGDIGPKTYERARREIIDAIAATLGK